MAISSDERFIQSISNELVPMADANEVRAIVDDVKDRRIVMLGECTHGTAEFYAVRRAITQSLVKDHGFTLIALEADWPEAQVFHRFIRNLAGETAVNALKHSRRWPTWMWANTEAAHLLTWLHDYNRARPTFAKAGIYGLDLYSLFESIDVILKTVRRMDPDLANVLAERYECFEPFNRDEERYARSIREIPQGCRDEVLTNLQAVLGLRLGRMHLDETEIFDVQQNARVVTAAERYYRVMLDESENSWNVRDQHMLDTLNLVLERAGVGSKAIVWAHNTHIGDYRATTMHDRGYVNLGGLARESWGEENVALIGFSTFEGSVMAAPYWEGEMMEMDVPPARDGSLDACLEKAGERRGVENFYLPVSRRREVFEGFPKKAQRAIGVVYDPYSERIGNYVPTSFERRYDGIVFIRQTRALIPIPVVPLEHDLAQTWPSGL